jgi:hypothetical protein
LYYKNFSIFIKIYKSINIIIIINKFLKTVITIKKTTLGHVTLGFSPEGKQPKRHVALGLLPVGCSPSATWRFGLGTHRHGPRLALGWQGRTQNIIGSWPRADQAPRGAWAASPQALSTAPSSTWSASSWVLPKHHVALGFSTLFV